MKNTVKTYLKHLRKDRTRHRRLVAVLVCLSLVVAGGTTWSLHINGESQTGETWCGVEEHQHDDSCVEKVLICGYDTDGTVEADHIHSDECYEITYICGKEEHQHKLSCFSDPDADVETAADWEQTISSVELTGVYADDFLAIAKTQLGYAESSSNYQVVLDAEGNETTEINGYTRYGDWADDPYGSWNAYFVSFCLNYANVDYPFEPDGGDAIAALDELGLYSAADDWDPSVGDLVFLDTNGNGQSDRVGIVSQVDEGWLKVIEGDSNNAVEENTYTLDDASLLGCGIMLTDPGTAAYSAGENITITFAVNNGNYTNDPGSGNTHLTSTTIISGGDLTYTSWAKRYKVTGTGTICSFTIPAGSSLSDSEFTAPALTVENIGTTNTYSYISSRSWITESGRVVNAEKSVFTEDTTLYLQLYQNGEEYGLDFVFCENNHSVSYYTSWIVFYKLGQTIDQWYLDSATQAAETNSDAACNLGTDYGYTFVKWQLKNTSTGEMVDFTSETPITADYLNEQYGSTIKVYAVWDKEPTYSNVVFHDIQVDGTETASRECTLEDGLTLSDALAANGGSWADGTALADCVWYTVDAEGNKTLATVINGDMELYTYRYQLTLTLSETEQTGFAAWISSVFSADVSQDGRTLTITLREGETLSASDFVVDGVDYSMYTWVDSEGRTVTLSSLVGTTLSGDMILTSDGSLSDNIKSETITVNYYVFINGERVLRETDDQVTAYYGSDKLNSDTNRRYITAGTLEAVYGEFGFTASQLTAGTHYFPHTDVGSALIYGDTAVASYSGVYLSPVINHSGTADVYYLPNQSVTGSAGWSNYTSSETFYTITVSDPKKVVMEETETVSYVLTGSGKTITLETPADYEWRTDGGVSGTVADGLTTFAFVNVSDPITIWLVPEGSVTVTYILNLPATPADEYAAPKVGGSETVYVDYATHDEGYTVLTPSHTAYNYGVSGKKYLGEATFLGWTTTNGSSTIVYAAGATIDPLSSDVTLYGVWSTKLGDGQDSSVVNFYVSIVAVSEGTETWAGSTETDKFTNSVYAADCGVAGSTANSGTWTYDSTNVDTSTVGGQFYVLGGTSGTNLSENHESITTYLTSGELVHTVSGTNTVCQLTFPDDETVLRNIRSMVSSGTEITINGHTITADELTTANFTIKWYVFKEADDGWHIDGILVAKTGKLVVTKTFAGDETAVYAVKENWTASVQSQDASITVHDGSTLTLDDSSYTSYDAATDTYTWVVDVDQYYDYTVTENNYTYTENLYTTTAIYRVRNSMTADQNVSWTAYDATGITVTGGLGTESQRPTVSLMNTYTAPGTLILQKQDAATGDLMPNVSFGIAKTGEGFTLYDLGNGFYTAEPSEATNGTATTTVTTDTVGQAYLYIGGGTYTFTEVVPTGYDDPGTITVMLEGDTDNGFKVISIESHRAANDTDYRKFTDTGTTSGGENLVLIVKNYSRSISLTVTKIWADDENTDVTLQLYRNGVSMGSGYQMFFSTINGWTKTFESVPLYANGALAKYTLVEETIGDFNYSQDFSDGYRFYDVIMSPMVYKDEDGNVTSTPADIASIELTVTNKRDTGELKFTKVDDSGATLPGAVFYLYKATAEDGIYKAPTVLKDTDGTQSLYGLDYMSTATSGADGTVNFGSISADVYYLVEHSAPDGYTASDKVYLVAFAGSDGTQIKYWDSENEQWSAVLTSNSIVNNKIIRYANLTITKVASGNNGEALPGAQFTLENSDGAYYQGTNEATGKASFDSAVFTLTSDANGIISISGLPEGTYILTETKAPDGYLQLTYTIKIVVERNGSATVSREDGTEVSVVSKSTDNGYTVAFSVPNSSGYELPHTGGAGTYMFTLGGIAILAVVTLVYGCGLRRRRERRAE